MRCSSARASARFSSSPRDFATRCGSATRRGRRFSPATSSSRRCCTSARSRSTSACAPTAPWSGSRISRRCAAQLQDALADGIKAVAIVFMHAYRYPAHEQRVAALARELGFPQVSASHEVSPLIKLVSRGDTTVVDAYLSPILRRYVAQVAEATRSHCAGACGQAAPSPTLPRTPERETAAASGQAADQNIRLMFMTSAGGLTAAALFEGKDAILSGPAGGVVGMVETGRAAGFDRADRLRHGRHLHRRVAFRRRLRAHVRDRGGGRAHARPHDAHPYGGGRRRLDPAFRRGAPARRARFGRRRSGAQMLPPRRAAHGDRRQCDAGQADAGILPEDLRRQPATSRSTPRRCARRLRRSRARSAAGAAARRSRTASCGSRSRTWRTPSRRFRCSAATT